QPGAAVAFEVGAKEAKLRHLRDEMAREGFARVVVLDDRRHLALHEVANGLADHPLLVREEVVQAVIVHPRKWRHDEAPFRAGYIKTLITKTRKDQKHERSEWFRAFVDFVLS